MYLLRVPTSSKLMSIVSARVLQSPSKVLVMTY